MKEFPFKQAKNYTKGRVKPVQLIVLHSMEAPERVNTAENVAAYFAGSNAPMASAHYCVDADSIVQCVRLTDTAYHCKNANANGIGIEHAGYAKQTRGEWLDTYGKAMLELSAQLTAALCSRYSIPPRRAQFASKDNPRVVSPGICGHADVPNHGSHWDPGPHFPMDYYLERVKFYLDSSLERAAVDDIQPDELDSSPLPVLPPAEEIPETASVTIKDGDVKVETNKPAIPPEKIAIEKPPAKSFGTEIKKDLAVVGGGNIGFQGVRDVAEQAGGWGLSARFWLWVSIFAVVGGAAYILAKFFKWRSEVKRDLELTQQLIAANSTPTNRIVFVDSEKLEEFRANGYKIVTR